MVNPEDVRVVKLVSGDEFIAQVPEEDDVGILVVDPITMTVRPTERGTLGVDIDHWLGVTKEPKVRLRHEHVMYCEPPLQNFIDIYVKQFNKIDIPNPGGGIITPG
jgi:hypothetical protein